MAKIRLWKLGNLEHKITPTEQAIKRLLGLLEKSKTCQDNYYDIIWGPDIQVEIIDSEDINEDIVVLKQDCTRLMDGSYTFKGENNE